jgi:uncharacterized protein (DUF488 family)
MGMTSTIMTIGFAQKTAEQFFRLLQEAGAQSLLDIRENRIGQLAAFAKFPDLAFFLDRLLGIKYDYEPLLAPSAEMRKAYKATRDWQQYEDSFLKLMAERKVLERVDPSRFEGTIALLCSEPEPTQCHRRLVAELLAKHLTERGWQVEIRHLVLDRPVGRRRPKAKRTIGTDPR